MGSPVASFPTIPSIYKTTNSGVNWIPLYQGGLVNSIHFVNRNKGWAVGDSKVIVATSNSGNNWTNQTISQNGINYHSIHLTDSLTGWVVGDSGTILKTTTGGIVKINITNDIIPDNFYLHQNYPNPFNPVTIIKYDIPSNGKRLPDGKAGKTSDVKLIVYNALGKEIATLVNEKQNGGSYSVEFDASNYSSGVYFYKLTTGNHSDIKKMTLLK